MPTTNANTHALDPNKHPADPGTSIFSSPTNNLTRRPLSLPRADLTPFAPLLPGFQQARVPVARLQPLISDGLQKSLPGLTQRDLRLHGHGQRWVLDLTAEEGLIVDLRVEGPGEQGPHLHRAIAAWGAAVAQEVDRLGAVYPTGELSAHHCLWDVFRGGLHEKAGVLGEAARGALRVGTSSPIFSVQKGQ